MELNAIKNQALGAISNATGLSDDTLNAGLDTVKNIAGGENPIQTLQKAITNLANNKKSPKAIEKGVENALNILGTPIVENFQQGVNQAAQTFQQPLTSDEITKNQIYILIIARNITFGIIILWGVMIFLRNYTTFLTETQNEYIDKINKIMYTYTTVFILLLVIWILFSIPIYGLPYIGQATEFFNKLNHAIQIILTTVGGNTLL